MCTRTQRAQLNPRGRYRVAALVCFVTSVAIVWCEGTILVSGPPFDTNLSPLSHLFRVLGTGGGGPLRLALLFMPILYCAVCTYFAMFRMRLCDFYALHPQARLLCLRSSRSR
jgi:hypothetical protein